MAHFWKKFQGTHTSPANKRQFVKRIDVRTRKVILLTPKVKQLIAPSIW